MKKLRLLFSGLAVLTLVGTSLAFKPFASGLVYCSSSCTYGNQIQYKIDKNGSFTAPCGTGVQPYVLKGDTDCVATDSGTHFSATSDLGN